VVAALFLIVEEDGNVLDVDGARLHIEVARDGFL